MSTLKRALTGISIGLAFAAVFLILGGLWYLVVPGSILVAFLVYKTASD